MFYAIILIFFGLMCWINNYSIKYGKEEKSVLYGNKIYIFIIAIILVLFAGLRSTKVGSDTAMYKKIFDHVLNVNSLNIAIHDSVSSEIEAGFSTLIYYVSRKFDWQVFLFISSLISIVPVLYVIYKYSVNVYFSIFLYISFGFFSFSMNGIRQAIAIGICMIAYCFSRNKKLFLYLLCIFLAVSFHKSAILFLPVYWIDKIKPGKYILYIYLILLVLSFALRRPLYVFLNRYSRQSFEATTNQGGFGMFLFMFLTVMIGWIFKEWFLNDEIKKKENYSLLLMIAIMTLMWPIASLNAELNRMYYYYQIFVILYVPSLINSLKKYKVIVTSLYILVCVYFLYAYIINGQLQYSPYYFYWN